ncbi:hypothetical protein CBR_g12962 [Chara braunii]|uniref:Uncharacterized protein n=1 Tax=Chara braunii TaxID=69332 RepID=A0A388KT51_CHABU|nr:hypothetical protein CBR_g12962 [Chara braunii]|eukprot:GBG73244.1 hypothetical protein CBR_g12962 [Chara braunii]
MPRKQTRDHEPAPGHVQQDFWRKAVVYRYIVVGQKVDNKGVNMLQCTFCNKIWQGTQYYATKHFTQPNYCKKVSDEALFQIAQKCTHRFEIDQVERVRRYAQERGLDVPRFGAMGGEAERPAKGVGEGEDTPHSAEGGVARDGEGGGAAEEDETDVDLEVGVVEGERTPRGEGGVPEFDPVALQQVALQHPGGGPLPVLPSHSEIASMRAVEIHHTELAEELEEVRQPLWYFSAKLDEYHTWVVRQAKRYLLSQTGFNESSARYLEVCRQFEDVHMQQAERNWAVHEGIHTKKRNHLAFEKVVHLVEITANMRLMEYKRAGCGYVLPWQRDEGMLEAQAGLEVEPVRSGTRSGMTEKEIEEQAALITRDPIGSSVPPPIESVFGARAAIFRPYPRDDASADEREPEATDDPALPIPHDVDELHEEGDGGVERTHTARGAAKQADVDMMGVEEELWGSFRGMEERSPTTAREHTPPCTTLQEEMPAPTTAREELRPATTAWERTTVPAPAQEQTPAPTSTREQTRTYQPTMAMRRTRTSRRPTHPLPPTESSNGWEVSLPASYEVRGIDTEWRVVTLGRDQTFMMVECLWSGMRFNRGPGDDLYTDLRVTRTVYLPEIGWHMLGTEMALGHGLLPIFQRAARALNRIGQEVRGRRNVGLRTRVEVGGWREFRAPMAGLRCQVPRFMIDLVFGSLSRARELVNSTLTWIHHFQPQTTRMFYDVLIGSHHTDALVDGGAEITLVRKDFAKITGCSVNKETTGSVRGAGGEIPFSVYVTKCAAKAGGRESIWSFQRMTVMDEMDHDIILGRPWCANVEMIGMHLHDGTYMVDIEDPVTGRGELLRLIGTGGDMPKGKLATWSPSFEESARKGAFARMEGMRERVEIMIEEAFSKKQWVKMGLPQKMRRQEDDALGVMVVEKETEVELGANLSRPKEVQDEEAGITLKVPDLLHLIKAIRYHKLDLYSGYDQLPLDARDRPYTAMHTPVGQLQMQVTPMGFTNAVAEAQRRMLAVAEDMFPAKCEPYIDDNPIKGARDKDETQIQPGIQKFVWDHLQDIKEFLRRFLEYNITATGPKSILAVLEVTILGFRCGSYGRKPDPAKTDKISQWPTPLRTTTEVRAFLGVVGFFRIFIKGFAKIAEPIRAMIRKEGTLDWTEEREGVVQTLKDISTYEQVTLAAPCFNDEVGRPFVLETDWGPLAVRGVLIQREEDGRERPIRFESRTLNLVERRYSQFKKEVLIILHCLKTFQAYLFERRFILRKDPTDVPGALKNYKPIDPTVGRWVGLIWQFDYKIERIAGPRNRADGLSRVCISPEGVEDAKPIDAFLDYEGGTLAVENEMIEPACTSGELLIKTLEKESPAVVAELREGAVTRIGHKEERLVGRHCGASGRTDGNGCRRGARGGYELG